MPETRTAYRSASIVSTSGPEPSWAALATKREFDLWEEITRIEQSRAANAAIPEAEAVRDKLRLLKGSLKWDLERDFKSRLARLKREARETGGSGAASARPARRWSRRSALAARSTKPCAKSRSCLDHSTGVSRD